MSEQWKMVCKVKDVPLGGVRVVPRGLAWQELPGVALFRSADDRFFALLDRAPPGGALSGGVVGSDSVRCPDGCWAVDLASGRATSAGADGALTLRRYTVKIEEARLYLDVNEMNAPASKAEAALAGAFSVSTQFVSA